jgi:hypothetical protein
MLMLICCPYLGPKVLVCVTGCPLQRLPPKSEVINRIRRTLYKVVSSVVMGIAIVMLVPNKVLVS